MLRTGDSRPGSQTETAETMWAKDVLSQMVLDKRSVLEADEEDFDYAGGDDAFEDLDPEPLKDPPNFQKFAIMVVPPTSRAASTARPDRDLDSGAESHSSELFHNAESDELLDEAVEVPLSADAPAAIPLPSKTTAQVNAAVTAAVNKSGGNSGRDARAPHAPRPSVVDSAAAPAAESSTGNGAPSAADKHKAGRKSDSPKGGSPKESKRDNAGRPVVEPLLLPVVPPNTSRRHSRKGTF